jgi:hypothetical protein
MIKQTLRLSQINDSSKSIVVGKTFAVAKMASNGLIGGRILRHSYDQ